MLGHGEPIRVREGERVLFRMLNASGNMGISLALPGHRFQVLALDGNRVPTRAMVDILKLDVAERADVIVEMNNPGVWVFGSTDDEDRNMGMGVVVEYANRTGEPTWTAPTSKSWDYTAFGKTAGTAAAPDEISSKDTGTFQGFVLHAIDAVGLVHAMLLRIQALLLPIKTLVLSGH
jgi:FtsP/CotA-like multicopper oxidase with cupredoxin domain